MKYTLNVKEQEAADKFLKEQNQKAGKKGKLSFDFAPTGIGTATTVKHSITKASKNITDYTCW